MPYAKIKKFGASWNIDPPTGADLSVGGSGAIPPAITNGISTITTDIVGISPLTPQAFKVTGSLIPDVNIAYDLGTAEHKWRDLYLSTATIHTADGNISTTGGELQFDGEPVLMVSSLKSMVANANSWEDFKASIESL